MNWLSGSCVASASSSLSLTLLPPALCFDFDSAVTPSASSTGWTVTSPPALLPESHHHCLHHTITCMYCPGQGGEMTEQTDWQAKKAITTIFTTPSSACTALDKADWRKMTKQTDWQAKQPSQVVCTLEALQCWGAWCSWLCALGWCLGLLNWGHKAKKITPSITWRWKVQKEDALHSFLWKGERGPSSIRQTLELFQMKHWGMGFSECTDTILNWNDLNTIITITGINLFIQRWYNSISNAS